MNQPVNIYSTVVFDLHPKVREALDSLNASGQIDLSDGYPYLLSADKTGANFTLRIVRNGAEESVIMNTRKKADPIMSWDPKDGFKRTGGKKVITVNNDPNKPRPERARRPSVESFRRLTDQLLKG